MPTILVTGATGAVGSHVVRELQQRGVGVRALVRDPERATFGPEVELAVGDFADPGSLRAAMDGVDSVFLSCPNAPTQEEWETAAIDVAAEAGVRRIVKLSAFGAERGSPVAFWDAHVRIETHLRSGTVPFVLLKPHFFMRTSSAPRAASARPERSSCRWPARRSRWWTHATSPRPRR